MTISNTASLMRYLKGLVTNYTAARAGYLDELGAANIPADIDTLLSRLTAARAGYMDNLIAEISVVGSPYSQPNDVVEHDAIVVAAATQLVDIEIDVDALTQSNTIREYVQIDGANYRLITSKIYPTDFDPGVKAIVLSFPQKGQLYKITMQANVAEGAVRDVPYRIMTRGLN
jgi:hypothetical protein